MYFLFIGISFNKKKDFLEIYSVFDIESHLKKYFYISIYGYNKLMLVVDFISNKLFYETILF
jgi:hypothetical protein